tara:strand:- start:6062 stop:7183 length:1122 start_codon:yes stop_codon:yes gene_type:complete
MANFAFIYTPSEAWIGGKNYYLSLFSKLHDDLDSTLDTVTIFTADTLHIEDLKSFNKFKVVQSSLLKSHGIYRLAFRIANKLFGENSLLTYLFKSHNIDLLSHAYLPKWTKIKSLPWIPDFQHCVLPEYFSPEKLKYRNRIFKKYLANENFLLSSNSALKDARNFFDVKGKAWIYRFTPISSVNYDDENYKKLCLKMKIPESFVFLPNQFWKHKNHILCFKACLEAKNLNEPFNLVCSGGFSDYRDPSYSDFINNFIEKNNLFENIKLLGLIDRNIFNCFLRDAQVLVNPSKFEGWSTTVEEGKASNKVMALSSLNVHKEQTDGYETVEYFDVDDEQGCMYSIQNCLNTAPINNVSSLGSNDVSIYEILTSIK